LQEIATRPKPRDLPLTDALRAMGEGRPVLMT
jgi:hypothetical protein